ncbi:MAG TPA: sensor histidine kinase [Jiangellales bacterium]|nr:sensor histidine kinase [Jiangellales bacterium]
MRKATTAEHTATGVRHEALLYSGREEYVAGTVPFVLDGLAAGDDVLVVVGQERSEQMRTALGPAAGEVEFADMAEVGRNPARIIPAWQEFLDDRTARGRGVRGIGEPIWAARTSDELVECQRHEALLNVAFDGSPRWRLLCPYDVDSLRSDVLAEAVRTHPYVTAGGACQEVPVHVEEMAVHHLDAPLPEPRRVLEEVAFDHRRLRQVRTLVASTAERFGMDLSRTADLVMAANEVATNSVRHGGGRGEVRLWRDGRSLVCEVRDRGRLDEPMAGRREPAVGSLGGRGLWLTNQVCDLVQIRCYAEGTVVRLHLGIMSVP